MKRAYDMLRGYVNHEWERIKTIEWNDAIQELETAINNKISKPEAQKSEQVNDAYEALEDPQEVARNILGVRADATFDDIHRSFLRLNKRSNPLNFAEGSIEATNAARIQKRIHWAYQTLTDGTDETERRFRSLEID